MLFHIRFPWLRGSDSLARLSPIRQKATAFMKYRAGIFLALLLVFLFLRPGDVQSGSGIPDIAITSMAADQNAPVAAVSGYTGIPTFKIESVAADKTVTIKTSNFPPNQTFTVMMGPMGTRGINGVTVGKIESGQGGTLTRTFDIPDKFKGVSQIAIRAQTAHANPYYAYNWFYNNTANVTTAVTPSTTATTITSVAPYRGIPTIHICSVERDQTVTFRAINYPPNQNFTVTMGAMGTAGIGGAVVGAFDSGAGGTFDKTFNIPAHLHGAYKIAIRAQTVHAFPFYSYNWFYNSTASVCN